MMFLGRRRPGVTLVRAWCSPFGEDGPAGELLALVDQVLAAVPAQPLEGAINQGLTQPVLSLRRALARMRPAQLDTLRVLDAAGDLICCIDAEGASVGDRARAFEIFALLPPAADALQDRLLRLLMGHHLHYGYARALAAGLDPATEAAPVERGLFGAPLQLAGGRAGWLVPEPDVRAGAVRGVYPANVLSAVALARLAGTGLRLPSSLPTVGGQLWRLSLAEQAALVRLNPHGRAYVHVGSG